MLITKTDADIIIREATLDDIDDLNLLEKACFDSDRISRRSFRWMIEKGHSLLLVAHVDKQLVGYVLLLYSRGTSLGRVYSLAVAADFRKPVSRFV
jgi:ribosomal protein S18 acetylase RimI-like enzyme